MIHRAKVKNFKGLANIELSDLSKITVIGGKNNSGKSSVLEALFLVFDRKNVNMLMRQQNWRGLNQIAVTADAMWSSFFTSFDFSRTIEIEMDSDVGHERQAIVFDPHFSNNGVATQLQVSPGMGFNPVYSNAQALTFTYTINDQLSEKSHLIIDGRGISHFIEFADGNIPHPVVIFPPRIKFENDDAERFGKIDLNGQQDKIIAILKLMEPRLRGISSIRIAESTALYIDLGLPKKIPVGFAGDGFSRAVSILLAIATTPGGVVFIDEVENGIHYSVLPVLWEIIISAAREYDCQIITTTHSYELLRAVISAAEKTSFDEFSYVRIDSKDGDPVANNFTFSEITFALMSEIEVR